MIGLVAHEAPSEGLLRARAMLHLAHAQVRALAGSRLCTSTHVSRTGLTPRQRDVLDRLLTGACESEIAATLFRSPATIHEHILAVYRHFGVTTRAQLMSYLSSRRPATRGR